MDMEPETPLAGGNMADAVVRVGDTVRRPTGPQTPTIHRLLSHVRAQGLDWVPGAHGVDAQGREILDFIEGEVAHGEPPYLRTLETLTTVARRLRAWHDASATFERRPGDVWWWPGKEPAEVICHVDFAPYNHVYRDGVFVGAIDFDLCYPGPRLWDLAYTAYRYVPLTPPLDADVDDGPGADRSPFSQDVIVGRAQHMLDAYGAYVGADGGEARVESVPSLLGWLVPRLEAIADWGEQQAGAEQQAWARMYRAHAEWIANGGLGLAEPVEVRDVRR